MPANSSTAKPQGKPKNTGVGSLSLLHWIFLTQESEQGFLHFRRILCQLSYQESYNKGLIGIKTKSMPERISQHCLVFYVYCCKLPHKILLILFYSYFYFNKVIEIKDGFNLFSNINHFFALHSVLWNQA